MKEKQKYCSPGTEVLELRSEGVICTSDHNLSDYNLMVTDPFDGLFENLW